MVKILLLIFFITINLFALYPDELAVIANEESSNSVYIAHEYCRLRKIPKINIVRVSIKQDGNKFPVSLSADSFTELVWDKVSSELRDRGLEGRISGWIYSVDIPTTVSSSPDVSITGLTFVKNELPRGNDIIKGGYYRSAYYGGPMQSGRLLTAKSFSYAMRYSMASEKPLLSMMLGYTGERGNSVSEVKSYLERGLAADSTFPDGKVYFVTNSDVRTTCRLWQLDGALKKLEECNIETVVQSGYPSAEEDVLGIWVGQADIKEKLNCEYMPGAMVDNLTSFGAAFQNSAQTKLSEFLRAGASLACGTVTEPYAIWRKFPTAFFWYFYQSGCSAIEAFYQSTYCPLQQLFVGDPLTAPWKVEEKIRIEVLNESGKVYATYSSDKDLDRIEYKSAVWFLDGKEIGKGKKITIDLHKYSQPVHYLSVHIPRYGFVDTGCYDMVEIEATNE